MPVTEAALLPPQNAVFDGDQLQTYLPAVDHTIDPILLQADQQENSSSTDLGGVDNLFPAELEAFFDSQELGWDGVDAAQCRTTIHEETNGEFGKSDHRLPGGGCFTNPFLRIDSEVVGAPQSSHQQVVDEIVDGVAARLAAIRLVEGADKGKDRPRDANVSEGESDCSWDEQDHYGYFFNWTLHGLNQLNRGPEDPGVYVTEPLRKEKRRLVHALAHQRNFSHVTLGSGKKKFLLVSWANIDCEGPEARRCWNKVDSRWRIDPTTVAVRFRPGTMEQTVDTIVEMIRFETKVPWTQDGSSDYPHTYSAKLGTPTEAATIYSTLEARLNLGSAFECLQIGLGTWTSISRGKRQSNHPSTKFRFSPYVNTDGDGQRRDMTRHNTVWRPKNASTASQTGASEDDGYASAASGSSSKRSHSEYRADILHDKRTSSSQDSSSKGEAVLIPGESTSIMPGSNEDGLESTAKRIKRWPRCEGGYECRDPECGKVFNFNGERTKHEQIHKPESEYPHACEHCDKRFIERKDAKRHAKVHVKGWMRNFF